jgi:myo-inositol-1(or 4)-monophosphatase
VQGSDLLAVACDLAIIAGTRQAHWRARIEAHGWDRSQVTAKDDPNNLVTAADEEIESLVRGYLVRVRPGDVMIGEEGAAALDLEQVLDESQLAALLPRLRCTVAAGEGGSADVAGMAQSPDGADQCAGVDQCAGADRYEWHVDPIDGTVNFVRGIEYHCFSVGVRRLNGGGGAVADGAGGTRAAATAGGAVSGPVWESAGWVLGLVACPALDTVWFAEAPDPAGAGVPAGAWKLPPAGDPVRLHGTPVGRRGRLAATGFNYSPELRTRQLAELGRIMADFDDVRRLGSAAMDLCLAAEGRVNAYYERGLGVYDFAGGAVIAEQAGLRVRRPHAYDDYCIAADTPERFAFIESCLQD